MEEKRVESPIRFSLVVSAKTTASAHSFVVFFFFFPYKEKKPNADVLLSGKTFISFLQRLVNSLKENMTIGQGKGILLDLWILIIKKNQMID